jgi:hypothetical protein
MGDFDMFELAGDDTVLVPEDGIWIPEDPDPSNNPMYEYVQVWFFATSVVITVLMMNILIGILGANYELYEEQSQALFVRARARIIMTLSSRPWIARRWKDWEMQPYMYFTTKESASAEDERSSRKAIQIAIEAALKKQSVTLQEQILTALKQAERDQQKKNESFQEEILKALRRGEAAHQL